MTCIVALRDKQGITIGSDGLTVCGWDAEFNKQSKVFQLEDLTIGSMDATGLEIRTCH